MERTTKGRTNGPKTILITLGAVCLVILVGFLLNSGYKRMGPLPNFTDRNIAGATTITSQWLEIKPDPAMKPSGKTPLVILELEGDYEPDSDSQPRMKPPFPAMLRYPDGTLGLPEMQLVDERGNVFPLHFLMAHHRDRSGSNAIGGVGFGASDLPSDRSYSKLRIRSDQPMKCSKIIWRR